MTRRAAGKGLMIILSIAVLVSLGLTQQTMKIGVVNSQEVLEKSAEGKKVMAQLQEKDKQNTDKINKLDEEIRALQTKMNTQRLTLTQEAMANLAADIERKQTERKRYAEDSYRDMQELTTKLFQRIQNELLPIIEKLGAEKNLDIIFDLFKSGAIYFSPTIELTAEVIQRYDASKAAK